MDINKYKTTSDIMSEYNLLEKTYNHILQKKDEINTFIKKQKYDKIIFIACGSGFCVSQSATHSANLRGIPSVALPAGDLLLNFDSHKELLKNSIIIAPSRSGSSSELIMVLEKTSKMEIPCIALSGTTNSPLSKLADYVLETPWVKEDAICQTRTIISLYLFNLSIIAISSSENQDDLFEELNKAIDFAKKSIDQWHLELTPILLDNKINKVFNLADSEVWGIADEGTMAIKEMALMESYTYHILDVRHGPIMMIDDKSLVFILLSSNQETAQNDFIKDIKKKGATVVTVGPNNPSEVDSDLHLKMPYFKNQAVYGMQFIFPSQLTAVYKSAYRGLNPDAPLNLNPWIKI